MTIMTSTRLSDGRELLYFDADAESARRHQEPEQVRDRRGLPARNPDGGQLRFDELTGEWVAIAAHRQDRTHLPPEDECPLCPSDGTRRSEIPAGYEVAVFENRFPSFGPQLGGVPADPGPELHQDPEPSYGRCEVISFTDAHTGSFAELPYERVRTVVDAWAQRTETLSGLPGVQQVFCFENRGAEIGVTLHHPHGQIYAYPFVTPRALRIARLARRHFLRSGGLESQAAAILAAERTDGSRMVLEGRHFSAYVPFAARWPLEVHLVPHRHVADLSALGGAERDELAELYPELLRRFDALYDTPTPYIAAWHQAPVDPELRPAGHLHLQLTSPRRAADKLKYLAGSEAAMGAFINDTVPEETAARLREAGPA
ncbi:galactose-1-phosphate uridylyltransferase [Arthrobacter crystallopoietes BAB-32]|uniref:Galactose-1-phosphate uridylyltransferase n=1 Tax=Arthrobacter crystallopoietes BAB-32 TaxID=1246476 RepID=N1URA0_9MICC|nr:galactose-1-phosphate uridylyltransferase [Arthrobacter crystallopoietes]EMY32961.1 galactose-1-phosphate uridylyltransferase [Arthrobacter crystallopoietes BAB-32]